MHGPYIIYGSVTGEGIIIIIDILISDTRFYHIWRRPVWPGVARPAGDDDGGEGSDDEEAVLVVREACQTILELTVALCARQPIAVPTRPTEHHGVQTRKKADTCVLCHKPCADHGTYDHPIKAYLVCEMHDFDARVSASHAEISIPWHNIPHGEQLKKLHKALPSELVSWTCPKCDLE
jgi:hypothetical protein